MEANFTFIKSLSIIIIVFQLVCFIPGNGQELKRPNILLIVADDAGTDYSAYGSSYVVTPAFDRLAKEGLLFNRAYTPNAKCAPSRSSILTGRNPWQLEAAMNHAIYFPTQYKSYAEVLNKYGYSIGYSGKGYAPGKALNADGTPRNLLGKSYNNKTHTAPTNSISTNDYAGNLEDFLHQTEGKPWAFWVGFTEPHRPYEFGTGEKLGGKNKGMIRKIPTYWPDTDSIRTDMLDYAFEIEYADRQCAAILKLLEESGQLKNTLVIFTSDHGMPFPRVKGNQYEAANHIPLAILWPEKIKAPGRKIDDYVSLVDLAPTILEAAGIDWQTSGMHPAAGESLLPIFTATKSGQVQQTRNFVLVGQERHDYGRPGDVGYPVRGIHKDGMLYLTNYEPGRWPVCNPETGYLNCDGSPTKTFILNQRRSGVNRYFWKLNFGKRPSEELYALTDDPDCMKNLIANAKFQKLAASLRKELEEKLMAQGDLRMIGFGHLYEEYPFAEINGFYERFVHGESFDLSWISRSDIEKTLVDEEGNDIGVNGASK